MKLPRNIPIDLLRHQLVGELFAILFRKPIESESKKTYAYHTILEKLKHFNKISCKVLPQHIKIKYIISLYILVIKIVF